MKENHYAQEAEKRPTPICQRCGKRAFERKTKFGIRASCCGLWSWDRYPLVDAKTHEARNTAHKVFDQLWRGKSLKRAKAYELLADEMNLTKEQCHIKLMDYETASRVLVAVVAISERYGV